MKRGHIVVFTEDASCNAAISLWATESGFDVSVPANEHEASEELSRGKSIAFFSSRLWPKDGPLQTLGTLKARWPQLRIIYLPTPEDELVMISIARAGGVHAVLRRPPDRVAVLKQIEAAAAAV